MTRESKQEFESLSSLVGKLEPVAAGAATCMQSLVESEKWKYAPACLVSEVCQRTTAALREKATCTVAHMQLVCSLAIIAPSALSMYGAELLHSGEEILKASLTSWKHRKCAAKMLQAVVSVVDRNVLASELSSTVQVLESFRLDKMPHVRTAVWEALQTAKMVTTDDNCNQDNHREGPLGTGSRMTPHWRSVWGSHRSLSSSITESETSLRSSSPSCSGNGFNGKMRQTPLFPARGQVHAQESMARTSLTFTMDDDPDSSVCNCKCSDTSPFFTYFESNFADFGQFGVVRFQLYRCLHFVAQNHFHSSNGEFDFPSEEKTYFPKFYPGMRWKFA